jgi:hypothetical protein
MERNRFSIGLIVLLVGVVILLGEFGVFNFMAAVFWPIFVLVPGLLFHYLFFTRLMPSGVLIPGGILITYSIMFFLCNIFGWELMGFLWPGFILGVAIGLYEYYLFDHYKPSGAKVAAMILAVIAAVFFGFTLFFSAGKYFIAAGLILIGIFMIARRPKSY